MTQSDPDKLYLTKDNYNHLWENIIIYAIGNESASLAMRCTKLVLINRAKSIMLLDLWIILFGNSL